MRGLVILLVFWGFGGWSLESKAVDLDYSSKLVLRTGAGQFSNQGSLGGSTSVVGGFNLQYHRFLNSFLTAGVGYMAQFDLKTNGVPLAGFEIIGRAYLFKEGTVVTTTESWGSHKLQNNLSYYVVGLYGSRHFYLGDDFKSSDPAAQLEGECGVVNFGAGLDYRINRNFEFNAEFSMSMMSFAGTDQRVKISENMLWMGLNYVF